jgi:hypothetical protein
MLELRDGMNKCEETEREREGRDLNHRFVGKSCKKYAAFSEGVAGFWDIPQGAVLELRRSTNSH